MTEKVKRFCDRYFETLHGEKSAIDVGYSAKSARAQASQMLASDECQAYLSELKLKMQIETGITHKWVMDRFKHISDACVTAVPVMVFDYESKSMVIKKDADGNNVYTFDSSGANKSTEMLGRMIGAFEKDNEQTRAKNEIDISKLSEEAINNILNASK